MCLDPGQGKASNVEVNGLKKLEEIVRESFYINEPYLYQLDAMNSVLQGRDTIVIAGTGSGKSIIFQALPLTVPEGTVLVISPLVSLIQEQV
jgi:ATP-dependent DNA helicase RecQ